MQCFMYFSRCNSAETESIVMRTDGSDTGMVLEEDIRSGSSEVHSFNSFPPFFSSPVFALMISMINNASIHMGKRPSDGLCNLIGNESQHDVSW